MFVECLGNAGYQSLPLHKLNLTSKYATATVAIGIVDRMPMTCVHILIVLVGNIELFLVRCDKSPTGTYQTSDDMCDLHTLCAVRRPMGNRECQSQGGASNVPVGKGGNMSLFDTVYS